MRAERAKKKLKRHTHTHTHTHTHKETSRNEQKVDIQSSDIMKQNLKKSFIHK